MLKSKLNKLNEFIDSQYPKVRFEVELFINFDYPDENGDVAITPINFDLVLITNAGSSDYDCIVSKANIDEILFNGNYITLTKSDIDIFVKKLPKWRVETVQNYDEDLDYMTITSPIFKNPLLHKKLINQVIEIYKDICEDKDVNAILEI